MEGKGSTDMCFWLLGLELDNAMQCSAQSGGNMIASVAGRCCNCGLGVVGVVWMAISYFTFQEDSERSVSVCVQGSENKIPVRRIIGYTCRTILPP
jgi:hypothetical protein